MSTRILKVTIPPTGLVGRIQKPGRIVHVGWQGDEVCAWVETDIERPTMPLILAAFATGQEAEQPWSYVGTAQSPTLPLVFHVFQQRVEPVVDEHDDFAYTTADTQPRHPDRPGHRGGTHP